MAVLDVLERERLPQRAQEVGAYLQQRLTALGHPRIVEIRGPGLFIGVETTDSATAVAAVNRLRQTGILVGRTGPAGNVIKIRPPLVFTEHHADRPRDARPEREQRRTGFEVIRLQVTDQAIERRRRQPVRRGRGGDGRRVRDRRRASR